jgi:small subunit ribosomal protein S18
MCPGRGPGPGAESATQGHSVTERVSAPGSESVQFKENLVSSNRQYYRRRKVCKFCVEKIDSINYKDVKLLSQFVPERAKILPRRISGVCSPHQRQLSDAIKKARSIALLPFTTD